MLIMKDEIVLRFEQGWIQCQENYWVANWDHEKEENRTDILNESKSHYLMKVLEILDFHQTLPILNLN